VRYEALMSRRSIYRVIKNLKLGACKSAQMRAGVCYGGAGSYELERTDYGFAPKQMVAGRNHPADQEGEAAPEDALKGVCFVQYNRRKMLQEIPDARNRQARHQPSVTHIRGHDHNACVVQYLVA